MPEEDAFCVFVSLMKDYRLRELYKPSMADLGLCFHLLEKSLEELFPNLYLHFRAVVRISYKRGVYSRCGLLGLSEIRIL